MNHHPTSDASLFLLLFYVDAQAREPAAGAWRRRVDDFNDWARAVETRGELVFAETVAPGSAVAWVPTEDADAAAAAAPEPVGAPGQAGEPAGALELAGLCVVRVRDADGAMELARRAPSLGTGRRTAIRALHQG